MPPSQRSAASPQGFSPFFRQHFGLLMRHVLYLGGTIHDAEDAAQAAMMELLRRWQDIDDKLPYAKRVAINAFFKARTRGLDRVRTRQLETGNASPEARIDGNLVLWEDSEWVVGLLTALPPRQREVMAFVVDDFSPAEIAQMLGRTPTAVRNNLRAARERLALDLRRWRAAEQRSTREGTNDDR
jgi:RNA polymerase sigma-70 factor (ECF subfamily)